MTKHTTAPELANVADWFKSSYSGSGNNCVEVADLAATAYRAVAIRDSKDPAGPVLLVTTTAFSEFVRFVNTLTV
ncbi:DUF397 domain-containing protein [Streptomyces sp. CBMA156]|uniref:DUF397 domain-containing protein n=1 Tax=Streptomyces sp. CBMA156 TaxID=1930280 RepID=UPI001661F3D6|nr:DUF397 domain-containing protein [Streptomyces sp. CBMA156]MBD0670070.1 hypothetical protein [Streptomyces sp. CBMA156]